MACESITITDPASGDSAQIAPALGFNCYRYTRMLDGRATEVLWSHPEFTSGDQRPSGSGIPLLFPFGGRIEGTSFEYQGREFALEPGDQFGNAIHGFVLSRPWRVVDQTATSVEGEFHASRDDASLAARWPADFRIRVQYEVAGGALRSRVRVENPDTRPLPFGFATHAYFRLPPGGQGEAGDSVVTVPVGRACELVDLRPTGRSTGLGIFEPLNSGMRLGDTELDNIFTDIDFTDGRCETRIEHPASGAQLTQSFGDAFRHLVLYTPPHREAMCIEPYTALPDPFRLEAEGVETGFRKLAPGAAWETTIEIRLEAGSGDG